MFRLKTAFILVSLSTFAVADTNEVEDASKTPIVIEKLTPTLSDDELSLLKHKYQNDFTRLLSSEKELYLYDYRTQTLTPTSSLKSKGRVVALTNVSKSAILDSDYCRDLILMSNNVGVGASIKQNEESNLHFYLKEENTLISLFEKDMEKALEIYSKDDFKKLMQEITLASKSCLLLRENVKISDK